VTAIAEYARSIPSSVRTADRDSPLISPDLAIVCLWAMFGLSLTAAALVLAPKPSLNKQRKLTKAFARAV
jgi:hypothetical protein